VIIDINRYSHNFVYHTTTVKVCFLSGWLVMFLDIVFVDQGNYLYRMDVTVVGDSLL
jgi:hypothetical protein